MDQFEAVYADRDCLCRALERISGRYEQAQAAIEDLHRRTQRKTWQLQRMTRLAKRQQQRIRSLERQLDACGIVLVADNA